MNYSRFQEPKPERDYSGVQAELEFDTIEIEPGHMFSIQLSGDFEWDGTGWTADRLYLHTFREESRNVLSRDEDGMAWQGEVKSLFESTLRIDDRADFKTIVRAAEAWANKNYQPEDYA